LFLKRLTSMIAPDWLFRIASFIRVDPHELSVYEPAAIMRSVAGGGKRPSLESHQAAGEAQGNDLTPTLPFPLPPLPESGAAKPTAVRRPREPRSHQPSSDIAHLQRTILERPRLPSHLDELVILASLRFEQRDEPGGEVVERAGGHSGQGSRSPRVLSYRRAASGRDPRGRPRTCRCPRPRPTRRSSAAQRPSIKCRWPYRGRRRTRRLLRGSTRALCRGERVARVSTCSRCSSPITSAVSYRSSPILLRARRWRNARPSGSSNAWTRFGAGSSSAPKISLSEHKK
jgi:hypothetical protein